MGRLLGTIFSMGYNWNRREFRRFRNCALALTVLPIGMLLGAAALGALGWRYKLVAIELEVLLLIYAAVVFGWRRLPFVIEVGTLFAASSAGPRPGTERSLLADIRVSLDDYLQLIGAVIASEVTAGFIVLWLPIHSDPVLGLLGLPVTAAFIAYWVWQRGAMWWPRLVLWLASFTLAAGLVGLLMPPLMPEVTQLVASRRGTPDTAIAALMRGDATPLVAFWAIIVLLIIVQTGPYLLPTRAQSSARWAGRVIVAALVVTLLVTSIGWWSRGDPTATTIGGAQSIAVPLQQSKWSEPFMVPACTGWTPYPEPGKTVEVVAAEDGEPDRVRPERVYRYGPGMHPNMSGKRGPFRFRSRDGGQEVRISLTDNTYCYRAR